jgi:TonB family protein
MKKVILAAAIFLCCRQPALASVDPAMQQALDSARRRVDLSLDQTNPFELDIDFVFQLKSPIHGRLTFKWEAKDRWWRKIVAGDFHQIEVRNGEWHYTARNASSTPLLVDYLIGLLNFGLKPQDLTAKREKRRTEHGIEMNCIQVESKGSFDSSRDVCLSTASNDILLDERIEPPDVQRREEYGDYFDFGTHRYPRELVLFVNGSKVITAAVVNLASATFDESLLTPPPGAVARRDCDGLKPPVVIKASEVNFTPSAREKGGGVLMVAVTVGTDGSVTEVRLAGSSGLPLDADTVRTIQAYKFKPAMCGTDPVVSDITIEVNFRMQ